MEAVLFLLSVKVSTITAILFGPNPSYLKFSKFAPDAAEDLSIALSILSFGILKGICSAMQLPIYFVRPAKWKKYFNLINSEKDASRTRAIEIFPYFSSNLSKKKDSNKADAILIASYFHETYKND